MMNERWEAYEKTKPIKILLPDSYKIINLFHVTLL